MNKKDVQNAFDSCLTDVTFTGTHKKAILQGIKKHKRTVPIRLKGIAAVAVMAATLIVIVGLRSTRHNDDVYTTQGGAGPDTTAFTAVPTDEIVPLDILTEAEAIAISKDALVEKEKLERIAVDAFAYAGAESDEAWLISVTRAGTLIYEVTVNKQTLEAAIESKAPLIDEKEPSESELAMQALLAYEAEITKRKGVSLYWSLAEKAHRSELAKAAGVQSSKWDAMPSKGDIPMDEAIAFARESIKGKAATEAAAKEADSYNAYASFLRDSRGATTWYIQFESRDGKQLLPVEFPSKAKETVEEAEAVDTQALPIESFVTFYHNPTGGVKYHFDANCSSVSSKYLPLTPIEDGDLLKKLVPCKVCVHVR